MMTNVVRCLVMTTLYQVLGIKDFQVSLTSFNAALMYCECLQAECEAAKLYLGEQCHQACAC